VSPVPAIVANAVPAPVQAQPEVEIEVEQVASSKGYTQGGSASQTFEVTITQKRKKAETLAPVVPSGPFRWAMKLDDDTELDPNSALGLALGTFCTPLTENEPEPDAHQVKHIHSVKFLKLIANELLASRKRPGGFQKPVCVIGMPGIGKSTGIEALMACMGRNAKRCSFGLGTRQDDLIGRPKLENSSTGFDYGLLPTAMMAGDPFIEDEVASAQDGILAAQYSAMEPGGYLTIKDDKGQVIRPVRGFWLFGTDNSLGTDSSGLNAQSRATSPALKSRFLKFQLPVPTEADEVRVMLAWNIDKKIAKTVAKIGCAMRMMMQQGQSTSTWGYRESIDMGLLMETGMQSWQEAWNAVYGDSLEAGLQTVNWEAIKRIVPEEVPNV